MDVKQLKQKKVSAISLGCDKNKVDLEKILFNIKNFGMEVVPNIEDANIIIVNTCAFITPAINEAIENIFLAESMKNALCEKVIVTGCLPARYKEELNNIFTNVDAIIDVKDNDKIIEVIKTLFNVNCKYEYKNGRLLTNSNHYSFLKIADGCDNGCAYCTIPRIRGRYKSIPIDALIKEAKELSSKGVKELILVAQDVTRYGIDIYNENKLVELIKELSKIKNINWIRLHYCYPEMVDTKLLDEINNNPKVCKYIDIPFQHIDNEILKQMNRKSSEEQLRNLVSLLHNNYPNISVRSTFIVGFPGETKKQFNKLLNFLEDAKLNNVGFFPYYREEKTKAYFMKKQISTFIKKRRLKKAQKVQEKVMNAININKIGSREMVIIDKFDTNINKYIARTQGNSPEVDFEVLIDSTHELKIGEFYMVKLNNYLAPYFEGEVTNEFTK